MIDCPILELGTLLRKVPDELRSPHPLVMIRDAYAYGYADRLWSRRSAVWILFRAVMERAESYGNGNKASRRADRLKEGLA